MTTPHAMLDWLLQGLAFAAVAMVAVGLMNRMNAATRERVWWIAMFSVAVIPFAKWIVAAGAISMPAGVSAGLLSSPAPLVALPAPPATWSLALQWAWWLWIFASVSRIVVDLWRLSRAKRLAAHLALDQQSRFSRWMRLRQAGRSARLAISTHVHRAAVLGFGTPTIAMTPAVFGCLTDEELDQVIVHEYAHVQRYDDRAILLQRIVMAVAGFHPAIWWLNRAITIEREVACDDWVVAEGTTPKKYADGLLRLVSADRVPRWGISPAIVWRRSQLALRVERLLGSGRNRSLECSRPALLGCRVAALALLAGAAGTTLAGIADQATATLPEPVSLEAPRELADETFVRPNVSTVERPRAARPETRKPAEPARPLEVSDPSVPLAATPLTADYAPVSTPATNVDVLPAAVISVPTIRVSAADSMVPHDHEAGSPWMAAAGVGVAMGDASRNAAVSTAGFFSRIGKSIGNSF